MSDPEALVLVQSWPQAFVAIAAIAAFVIWPGILAWLNSKKAHSNTVEIKQKISESNDSTNIIKKTLTETNGGAHVKDQLNEILTAVTDLHEWREAHKEWSDNLAATVQERGTLCEKADRFTRTMLEQVLKQLGQVEDIVTDPNTRAGVSHGADQ